MRLTAAVTLLLALPAFGERVVVRTVAVGGAAWTYGTLHLTPDCTSDPCPAPVQTRSLPLRTGEPVSVELESGAWRLKAEIPSAWSPELRWIAGQSQGDLVLPVWPAGQLAGTVAPEKGMPVPKSVSVRIDTPPETRNGVAPVSATVSATLVCPVIGAKFACAVPATPLDVRIEAPDAVPFYFWGMAIPGDKPASAGVLQLRRGASVTGWVTARGTLPGEVTVALAPVTHGDDPDARGEARTQTVKANARGFFQFRGVPVGTYTVIASSRGWSPARSDDVSIAETREYAQRTPLALEPLTELQVSVQPPVSPDGEPWTLKLDREIPLSNVYRPVTSGPAGADGVWRQGGLETGRYRLLVTDRRGAVFGDRDVTLPHDSVTSLTLSAVAVRGKVTVGDEPLEADLHFRDPSGKSARFRSDAEGAFQGTLANEGTWNVRVAPAEGLMRIDPRPVEVRRAEGEELATVDIALPGGTVRGKVVDERGAGVAADVAAFRDGRIAGQAGTDESGDFRIIGLPEGELRLEAAIADGTGEAAPVTASTNGPEVRIVMRTRRAATGWVTDERGNPVAGALLRYGSRGASLPDEAVTGPDGEFELRLPAGATADFVVLAPGFPAKLLSATAPARRGERLDIVLGRLAGILTIRPGNAPPWPYLHAATASAPLPFLFLPSLSGPPPGLGRDGFTVTIEPGTYSVCAGPLRDERCVTATVVPGGHTMLDARPVSATEPAREP